MDFITKPEKTRKEKHSNKKINQPRSKFQCKNRRYIMLEIPNGNYLLERSSRTTAWNDRMGNRAGFEDAWREEEKRKKEKKRHAVGGKLSKETSRRWTRWEIMHGQGGRKREKYPGRCARFTWLRCTRMHLQPPIHSRDDGGCSDPLPSPGINGTPPTHGILIEFYSNTKKTIDLPRRCFNGERRSECLCRCCQSGKNSKEHGRRYSRSFSFSLSLS